MILFFDRDFGTRVPKALAQLQLPTKHSIPVEWHQRHFPIDSLDDDWMPKVGGWGWTIVGHDKNHAERLPELTAIKDYEIGCFSMWGASNSSWEKMQCFARAFDALVDAERNTPRPFLYDIDRLGRLTKVDLP